MLANTIGEAMLVETLRMAAYFLNHSTKTIFRNRHSRIELKEAEQCYYFFQSSGLEIALNRFQLNYNADALRSTFNYYVRRSL